jgi:hypothetical protein
MILEAFGRSAIEIPDSKAHDYALLVREAVSENHLLDPQLSKILWLSTNT